MAVVIIKNFEKFKEFVSQNSNLKRCIVRVDLNLPSDIVDLSRIYAIKDTILNIIKLGLNVVLISHYKRPTTEDIVNEKFSLKNVVDDVSKILKHRVHFEKTSVFDMSPESITLPITLMENLRFYEGEIKNDAELAERFAKFGDIYINDAFSVSHRSHSSVCAITRYLPSFAGLSMQKEVEELSSVTNNITRPFTAIIGGSKVSSKIDVLKQISQTADYLVIAGAMANTFLTANGHNLKNSMVEHEQIQIATNILAKSKAQIVLPIDFLAATSIEKRGENYVLDEIPDEFSCFDIGKASISQIMQVIEKSNTLLWNGALGAFEFSNFDTSSKIITKYIVERVKASKLTSVVGGGETVASIGKYKNDMTFTSTAGGAFLEFIAGYELPGIKALCVN
jgi:phosphoglycerate kinase